MLWADTGDDITTALHQVGTGVAADLATVAGGADMHLDLDALRAYYTAVTEVWHQLDDLVRTLDAPAPPAPGAIPGVTAALTATTQSCSGQISLRTACCTIRSEVGNHLAALRENYLAYLCRESDNVARLSKAAGGEKPLGW